MEVAMEQLAPLGSLLGQPDDERGGGGGWDDSAYESTARKLVQYGVEITKLVRDLQARLDRDRLELGALAAANMDIVKNNGTAVAAMETAKQVEAQADFAAKLSEAEAEAQRRERELIAEASGKLAESMSSAERRVQELDCQFQQLTSQLQQSVADSKGELEVAASAARRREEELVSEIEQLTSQLQQSVADSKVQLEVAASAARLREEELRAELKAAAEKLEREQEPPCTPPQSFSGAADVEGAQEYSTPKGGSPRPSTDSCGGAGHDEFSSLAPELGAPIAAASTAAGASGRSQVEPWLVPEAVRAGVYPPGLVRRRVAALEDTILADAPALGAAVAAECGSVADGEVTPLVRPSAAAADDGSRADEVPTPVVGGADAEDGVGVGGTAGADQGGAPGNPLEAHEVERRLLITRVNETKNRDSRSKRRWLDFTSIRCLPGLGCQPHYCLCKARNTVNVPDIVLRGFLALEEPYLQEEAGIAPTDAWFRWRGATAAASSIEQRAVSHIGGAGWSCPAPSSAPSLAVATMSDNTQAELADPDVPTSSAVGVVAFDKITDEAEAQDETKPVEGQVVGGAAHADAQADAEDRASRSSRSTCWDSAAGDAAVGDNKVGEGVEEGSGEDKARSREPTSCPLPGPADCAVLPVPDGSPREFGAGLRAQALPPSSSPRADSGAKPPTKAPPSAAGELAVKAPPIGSSPRAYSSTEPPTKAPPPAAGEPAVKAPPPHGICSEELLVQHPVRTHPAGAVAAAGARSEVTLKAPPPLLPGSQESLATKAPPAAAAASGSGEPPAQVLPSAGQLPPAAAASSGGDVPAKAPPPIGRVLELPAKGPPVKAPPTAFGHLDEPLQPTLEAAMPQPTGEATGPPVKAPPGGPGVGSSAAGMQTPKKAPPAAAAVAATAGVVPTKQPPPVKAAPGLAVGVPAKQAPAPLPESPVAAKAPPPAAAAAMASPTLAVATKAPPLLSVPAVGAAPADSTPLRKAPPPRAPAGAGECGIVPESSPPCKAPSPAVPSASTGSGLEGVAVKAPPPGTEVVAKAPPPPFVGGHVLAKVPPAGLSGPMLHGGTGVAAVVSAPAMAALPKGLPNLDSPLSSARRLPTKAPPASGVLQPPSPAVQSSPRQSPAAVSGDGVAPLPHKAPPPSRGEAHVPVNAAPPHGDIPTKAPPAGPFGTFAPTLRPHTGGTGSGNSPPVKAPPLADGGPALRAPPTGHAGAAAVVAGSALGPTIKAKAPPPSVGGGGPPLSSLAGGGSGSPPIKAPPVVMVKSPPPPPPPS